MSFRLLVCLPTYNEEDSIVLMIEQLRSTGYDFIVCDGFSKDDTVVLAKAKGVKILARKHKGKGWAIRAGLDYAQANGYSHMATIDCDNTYRVDDIKRLAACAESGQYDLVIGERPFECIAWHRRIANQWISWYTNLLWRSGTRDIVSGLRIYRVESYVNTLKANSFDLEPRSLALACKKGWRYTSLPISYGERLGESKANLVELLRIMWGASHEKFTK